MAAAIGLAFILTFPVVTQMGSGARLDSADGQFSVWSGGARFVLGRDSQPA